MLNDFRALDFFKENIDWDEVRNKLSAVDWDDLSSNDNVETMLASFLSTLLDICKGSIPPRRTPGTTRWQTILRYRRILMRKRTRLRK